MLGGLLVIDNETAVGMETPVRGSVVCTSHQLSVFEAKFVSVTVAGNGNLRSPSFIV